MEVKPILTMVYFSAFPSMHAAGPAGTIERLAEELSEYFNITVISLNFDRSRREELFHNRDSVTTKRTGYNILYLPYKFSSIFELYERLRKNQGSLTIHCLYDFRLSIPALLISLLVRPRKKVVHLPHGIFMDVIQNKHQLRKRLFCSFLAWRPIRARVIHVASSPREMAEVKKRVGPNARAVVIAHFASNFVRFLQQPQREKVVGALTIAFVGRVVEQKNLIFAIEALAAAGVAAQLHVFGEASDNKYVRECQRIVLERKVSELVIFRGMLTREMLLLEMSKMDLFFLPTRGENFGHAILEALSIGLPVLLSTETPWNDVGTYQAGWTLDLVEREKFSARIRSAFDADDEIWSRFREGARRYAASKNNNPDLILAWRKVLD